MQCHIALEGAGEQLAIRRMQFNVLSVTVASESEVRGWAAQVNACCVAIRGACELYVGVNRGWLLHINGGRTRHWSVL